MMGLLWVGYGEKKWPSVIWEHHQQRMACGNGSDFVCVCETDPSIILQNRLK